jgi:Flp pilus assembly CpaF family ATPase
MTSRYPPGRIILGETRSGEGSSLLQLLNTGHNGTLSTVHANSAAQGISRFTTVLQRGVDMPHRTIKVNIAESLLVNCGRTCTEQRRALEGLPKTEARRGMGDSQESKPGSRRWRRTASSLTSF